MEMIELEPQSSVVRLSDDEMVILSNALNEVCNGLDVPEFSTRMGFEREEAAALLDSIGELMRKKGIQ